MSLLLTGELPLQTAVLVHLDTALRVISEDDLPLIERALDAAEAATRGESWEHLMSDLIDRTPELPAHLKPGGVS